MPNTSFSEELISIDEFLKRKRQNDKLTHWAKTSAEDELYHYGMPRRSGRYKWGSGERPYQGDEGSITAIRKKAQKSIDSNRKKTQDDLKRERKEAHDKSVDEAYEYFRQKKQEKADEERPMSALLREANSRAQSINTKKVLKEAEEKARKKDLDDEAEKLKSKTEEDSRDDYVKTSNSDGSSPVKMVYTDKNGNKHTVYTNEYKNGKRSASVDDITENFKKASSSQQSSEQSSAKSTSSNNTQAKQTPSENASNFYATKRARDMTTEELKNFNMRRKLAEQYNKYYDQDNPSKLSILSDVAKSGSELTKEAKRGVEDYYTQKHKEEKARIDLSGVSDTDLRRIINRMQMEQQYHNLVPDVISAGESRTKSIVNALDTTLAASSKVLGIADIIRKSMGY